VYRTMGGMVVGPRVAEPEPKHWPEPELEPEYRSFGSGSGKVF
jgi:hypothetical protein